MHHLNTLSRDVITQYVRLTKYLNSELSISLNILAGDVTSHAAESQPFCVLVYTPKYSSVNRFLGFTAAGCSCTYKYIFIYIWFPCMVAAAGSLCATQHWQCRRRQQRPRRRRRQVFVRYHGNGTRHRRWRNTSSADVMGGETQGKLYVILHLYVLQQLPCHAACYTCLVTSVSMCVCDCHV